MKMSGIGARVFRRVLAQHSSTQYLFRRTYTTAQSQTDCYAHLQSRSLLQLSGADASKFLQGMITNQMMKLEHGGEGFLCAFLNANGRVLFDAFIYPLHQASTYQQDGPSFLIEHASSISSQLQTHLKRFKLRSKFAMDDVTSSYSVYQLFGPGTDSLWGQYIPATTTTLPPGTFVPRPQFTEIGMKDTRAPGLGLRVVVQKDMSLDSIVSGFTGVSEDQYHVKRIELGVPEGPNDFIMGQSLPLESNLDIMGGADFRKGCYLGQELTIRTYHRGVTRKRIVPIQITGPVIPPHLTEIKLGSKSVGKILSTHPHKIGLALLRLEHADQTLSCTWVDEKDTSHECVINAGVPTWWPKPLENQ